MEGKSAVKRINPQLQSKLFVFFGKNGTFIIMLYPLLALLFMSFFEELGFWYSSSLVYILGEFGIQAEILEQQLSEELWLLSDYSEFVISLPGTVSLTYPTLLFQKIQFVIVMLCMGLGLHIASWKKLRYLMVIPVYCGFIFLQDLVVASILYASDTQFDLLLLGSMTLVSSSYFGSLILLYTIFHTADLPDPVKVTPKLKRNSKKYYYVLIISLLSTIGLIYYVLVPLLQTFDYVISVAILALMMFNFFRVVIYGLGYMFSSLDKPMRSFSYFPLVTVQIPAYNEEKGILTTLNLVEKAVLHYNGTVEVTVIDDKCTDRTREIVEEKFKNSKLLHGKIIAGLGKGKSAGMNLALKEANGELLLMLDADTHVTPNIISELVTYFIDPEVGGVGPHVEQRNENGLLRKMFAIDLLFIFGFVKPGQQGLDVIMTIIGGASMYRTKILQEVGGWGPIRTGDDGDMTLRVARYGYKILQHKQEVLARSEIFAGLREWVIQFTRWYMAYFYTHARNRTAVKERQAGLRATYQMPMVYAGAFTRFTTMLHTEIIILVFIASILYQGFENLETLAIFAIIINPMLAIMVLLALYYHKPKIILYFFLWPVYSYLQMICGFRALTVVMGDEGWETKASV